jgi:hypothetical protein
VVESLYSGGNERRSLPRANWLRIRDEREPAERVQTPELSVAGELEIRVVGASDCLPQRPEVSRRCTALPVTRTRTGERRMRPAKPRERAAW